MPRDADDVYAKERCLMLSARVDKSLTQRLFDDVPIFVVFRCRLLFYLFNALSMLR